LTDSKTENAHDCITLRPGFDDEIIEDYLLASGILTFLTAKWL